MTVAQALSRHAVGCYNTGLAATLSVKGRLDERNGAGRAPVRATGARGGRLPASTGRARQEAAAAGAHSQQVSHSSGSPHSTGESQQLEPTLNR